MKSESKVYRIRVTMSGTNLTKAQIEQALSSLGEARVTRFRALVDELKPTPNASPTNESAPEKPSKAKPKGKPKAKAKKAPKVDETCALCDSGEEPGHEH